MLRKSLIFVTMLAHFALIPMASADQESSPNSQESKAEETDTNLWFTLVLDVKEGKLQEFLEAMKEVVGETRQEPGVIQYDLLVDLKNERRFNLVQRYASKDALTSHMASEHTQRGFAKVLPTLAKPFEQNDYVSTGL